MCEREGDTEREREREREREEALREKHVRHNLRNKTKEIQTISGETLTTGKQKQQQSQEHNKRDGGIGNTIRQAGLHSGQLSSPQRSCD